MGMHDINQVAVLNALLRKDLSSFVERTFASASPGNSYRHNWHIDAIAYALEQVADGAIKRLIITVPPRSLKSIAASVAFPAWLLGHKPSMRVLAEKLALDCIKTIEAPWYRTCFPMTRIAKGRGGRADFETTKGGGRFSTSVGGTLTGRGGDIILIDDPHKPEDAASDIRRQSVLDWYRSTLLSRLNDPETGGIVVIQQRVHEDDLAGMLLEQGGWQHINLPAIAEQTATIDLGRRGTKQYAQGDLLHQDRLPRHLLDQRRIELGSYVYAAQYQQRPAPIGGGIVKWDWFKTYDQPPVRQGGDLIVQSWDTASKAEEANDYSVCTTWYKRSGSAWLIDVVRAKLEFPELRRRIDSEAKRAGADMILIEEAGSGIQLVQDIRSNTRLNVVGIVPKHDKCTRLLAVCPLVEGGRISIPREASWLADFRHELTLFPNGRNDDQVDSFSQFLNWLDRPQLPTAVSGTHGTRR